LVIAIACVSCTWADTSLESLYILKCSGCHGQNGKGVPEAGIPNLHGAGLYVGTPLGREYLIKVPGLSQSDLDNLTVARLLNWILHRFSADHLAPDFKPYTSEEVALSRKDIASDAVKRRAALLSGLRMRGLLDKSFEDEEMEEK
jgi:hypothetical protein